MWNFEKERLSYNNMGTKNRSVFPKQFIDICKKSQAELKEYVKQELLGYYEKVIENDGYVYAPGSFPVVLTAHLDTVHKELVKTFWGYKGKDGQHIISSSEGIGGDDRCGVFMILNILYNTDYRPTIIFCEDEEIGGIGSNKFLKDKVELPEVKFFIELDRGGATDLVFYDDDNVKFADWCEEVTGYKTAFGSFSDISHLCPSYKISGVNISCGYHNAHTTDEYVVLEEMMASIEATKALLEASKEIEEVFKYVPYERYYYNRSALSDYYNYSGYSTNKKKDFLMHVVFYYCDREINEYEMQEEEITSESLTGAIGIFLTEHPNVCWADVIDYEVID